VATLTTTTISTVPTNVFKIRIQGGLSGHNYAALSSSAEYATMNAKNAFSDGAYFTLNSAGHLISPSGLIANQDAIEILSGIFFNSASTIQSLNLSPVVCTIQPSTYQLLCSSGSDTVTQDCLGTVNLGAITVCPVVSLYAVLS
jgi:hypothetical protein